ncbi:GTP cyclohydrolase 1 [Nymphaea colorata]|nr:GTP cyclohydrolase 1 [Nymphaea colorata]
MGALDEGCFEVDVGNDVKLGIMSVCEDLDDGEEVLEEDGGIAVIEDAVKVLLQGLGEDVNREGLKKTPLRVAKALCDGTRGYKQKVKDIVDGALFPEAGVDSRIGHAGGAGGLVVVRGLDLFSYCESCLLPFKVRCHVGYIPSGQRVVGLSKLSRVSDVFARRLQNPHRLANEISAALYNSIRPAGVAVFLQCWHIQFPEEEDGHAQVFSSEEMHGWKEVPVRAGSGVFEDEKSNVWTDFSALLKFKGVNIEKAQVKQPVYQSWCIAGSKELCNGHGAKNGFNSRNATKPGGTNQSAMTSAAISILHALGEDPSRAGLAGTPHRFIQWLTNFKRSSLELKPSLFGNPNSGWQSHNGNGKIKNLGNGYMSNLCSELNLPFWSQCEHHLLPFQGVVHIGYIADEEQVVVERSSMQSLVHFYGYHLQVQERLTRQIAESVYSVFSRGVIVVVEANHICMISRGIEKVGSSTATIAVLGHLASDSEAKAKFLQTVSKRSASGS